jgi:hypothetical protein
MIQLDCFQITTEHTRNEAYIKIQPKIQPKELDVLKAIQALGSANFHEITAWINDNPEMEGITNTSVTARVNALKKEDRPGGALVKPDEAKLYRFPNSKTISNPMTYKLTPKGREYLRRMK